MIWHESDIKYSKPCGPQNIIIKIIKEKLINEKCK